MPYPYFNAQAGDLASNVRAASEFLTAHGAQQAGEQDQWSARHSMGAPLATYAYPLHFGRVMHIAIFPHRDKPDQVQIAFECRGITAMDMGKARRFTEQLRTDFRKQNFESKRERAGG